MLKRHAIIDVTRWTGEQLVDNIIIDTATSTNAFPKLLVIGLLFSRNCATLRYGLFRTVSHQIRRMQAAEA